MEQELPDSRFYMWRAVLAMIHADGVVTPHEVSFVNEQVRDVGFSQAQLYILSQDFKIPQDVYMMFAKITEEEDQYDFFVLARAVSWCDGDFARQEEHILDVLETRHMDEDRQSLLRQSRDSVNEIELHESQWVGKTQKSQTLLGFLNRLVTA